MTAIFLPASLSALVMVNRDVSELYQAVHTGYSEQKGFFEIVYVLAAITSHL